MIDWKPENGGAFPGISAQGNVIRGQQRLEMLSAEKCVFAFALNRQRIEADKDLVDHARVTHDDTGLRQTVEKSLHQRPEMGLSGKIIGTGESRVERDIGARGTAAKLRAQGVENQCLGRAQSPD